MTDCLANPCPLHNTQAETEEPTEVLIHGPSWRTRMKNDEHFRTVVLPELKGWTIQRNPLGWLDVITPWRPEVLQ